MSPEPARAPGSFGSPVWLVCFRGHSRWLLASTSQCAQGDLIDHEVAVERDAIRRDPESEKAELVDLYVQRVAAALHEDPEVALEVHAREELGVGPEGVGSPPAAAASSFITFAVGAAIPLVPWFFVSGMRAASVSIVLAGAAALAIGAVVAHFAGRSVVWGAARQLLITVGAAAITFGVGHLIGVGAA